MSIALIALLLICTIHLVMGLFVFLKNRKDLANRYFFGFTVNITGWLLANYFSNLTSLGPSTLIFVNKLVFIFPALAAFFVLMFSLAFTGLYNSIRPWIRFLITGLALLVTGVSFTDLVVSGIIPGSDGIYNITFGPVAPLYVSFVVIYFGLVLPIFVFSLTKAEGRVNRTRYQYVVAGILISAGVIIITNLLLPLLFHDYNFTGIGPYVTLILVTSITYAIVKHRLFELRLIVARSVAYSLLLLTFASGYAGIVFGISRYLLGGSNGSSQTAAYTLVALALAITFEPLRRFFERLTNRIFYHDQYNSRQVLDAISRILVSELALDRLMSRSLDTLCREMHLEFGQLIIFNDERVYRIEHYGPLPTRLMVVPELRRLGTGQVVADELSGGERKGLLDDHGIRISLGLKTGDEFVGYLLLGDRLSGDSYGKADLELLAILGKELAVGISNAKAYAEIQEFNKTLQDKVDHATGRLRVANRHLKELDKTKDEFISMASHQLRTPLTTIKGYLSMMTEGDAGKLSATQREFVGYAFDASERMVNLISDLLNVSRLEAGRFLIQTKPTDINVMVADEVRQLQQHALNKNLALTFIPSDGDMPLVDLDEGKTRQVIMNFIDNAIYYTKQGGVTVRVTRHDTDVRLEVTDTGIGVPENAKNKLFSKFFRAENAQGVRPDGTGLGLYLARRVIADQNGTIIFRSSEGHGSTFGFELPIKRASGKAK